MGVVYIVGLDVVKAVLKYESLSRRSPGSHRAIFLGFKSVTLGEKEQTETGRSKPI
jgi:hypothetical protein